MEPHTTLWCLEPSRTAARRARTKAAAWWWPATADGNWIGGQCAPSIKWHKAGIIQLILISPAPHPHVSSSSWRRCYSNAQSSPIRPCHKLDWYERRRAFVETAFSCMGSRQPSSRVQYRHCTLEQLLRTRWTRDGSAVMMWQYFFALHARHNSYIIGHFTVQLSLHRTKW